MILTQPDKDWAWMVMLGSFGAHVVHGFFLYAVGIIHVALLDRYKEHVAKTAWAGAIFLGLYSLTGPLAGVISNRWSCRTCMFLGSILMTSGFAISAFVPSLDWILVTIGVIGGLGAGLCYCSSIVVVGFNFERKRNLASGVAVSGCGIGAFILSPLMQTARDVYGYSGFCLMCAGLSLQMLVFGALFRPSYLEEHRKELHRQHIRKEKQKTGINKICSNLRTCKILKNKAVASLSLSMSFACFGVYLLYIHFANFVIENGSTALNASFLLSISGLLNAFARFLMGVAANSDNINELLMYSGCYFVLGAMGILFPFYGTSYTGQVVFVSVLGIYSGCCYAILNTINIQIVGIKDLASAYGIEMFLAGIGSTLGPPAAGFIIDKGGSYSITFMLGGCAILTGAIFGVVIPCCKEGENTTIDGGLHNIDIEIENAPEQKQDITYTWDTDIIKDNNSSALNSFKDMQNDINSSNLDIRDASCLDEQTSLFIEKSDL